MINELSEHQKKLLPILEWFHNYCGENNITYYVLGGTMLGAIRHKGFIPWDDDIDVGLPRPDYERFLELTKNRKFGNYIVEGADTPNLDFFYGYSKIFDTTTTLVENTRYKTKRGIYIDVFPLDGAGNDLSEAGELFKPIGRKYSLLLARTCGIRKERKFYKNLAIIISRAIPSFIVDNKKLLLSIDELCKVKSFDDSKYVANFLGNYGEREIAPKTVFGEPTLYQFENISVYGAQQGEEYLTLLYGDWQTPPPVEKQRSHHDFLYCDLNKPYLSE